MRSTEVLVFVLAFINIYLAAVAVGMWESQAAFFA
jgi:hypothetical protein